MTENITPPPKLNKQQFCSAVRRWLNSHSPETWQVAVRYFDAHPNAFGELEPNERGDLIMEIFEGRSTQKFEKLRRVLMEGCRWDDEPVSKESVWDFLMDPSIDLPRTLMFAQADGFHSAMQWLELFRLGGGVPLDSKVGVSDTVALTFMHIQLWQALAAKAQEDTYHDRAKAQLPFILAAAKAAGMPVEGVREHDPVPWEGEFARDNIAQILFDFGWYNNGGPAEYMHHAHRWMLDANVDIAAVWEKDDKPDRTVLAFKKECDTLGEPIRAALLSGASDDAERDVREITCLGQLPQLAKDMAKAGASEELLAACHNLPPYYREKYRHTLTSLPRRAAVEKSALAGYARGQA